MPNPVVHFEIACANAPKQFTFYGNLFGWDINAANPMNYGIVHTGGQGGINGGMFAAKDSGRPPLTFYVQVDNLQAYLDRAVALGGTLVVPPTPIPGMGSMAMFSDPEGNKIGLFKAA